jgi:hypothetical protein
MRLCYGLANPTPRDLGAPSSLAFPAISLTTPCQFFYNVTPFYHTSRDAPAYSWSVGTEQSIERRAAVPRGGRPAASRRAFSRRGPRV